MTMASSTTKPTDKVNANIVMLLIEKLSAYIIAQVPMSDTGTASAGMTVADPERRNRKITRTTSVIAMARVSWTSATDSRMEVVRSFWTFRLMPAGTASRYLGKFA